MKIQFLKEESLLTLKENIATNYKNYFESTNEWITDTCDSEDPFGDFKIEIPDFELFMGSDRPEDTDLENIRRIYTNMKNLTETQAADERLWSGLEHGQFWDYMQYRWHSGNRKSTPENIRSRFFYGYNKRRSIFTNTLSRLWWIGKLVYDEHSDDKFELLDFFKSDFSTKSRIMFSSNYTSNPTITRAALRVFKHYQDQDRIIPRNVWYGIIEYINVIGGTHILDYFAEEELVEKIEVKLAALLSTEDSQSESPNAETHILDEVAQLRLIKGEATVCPSCKNALENRACRIAVYSDKVTQTDMIEAITPYCDNCKKHFIKNEQLVELNRQVRPAHIKT